MDSGSMHSGVGSDSRQRQSTLSLRSHLRRRSTERSVGRPFTANSGLVPATPTSLKLEVIGNGSAHTLGPTDPTLGPRVRVARLIRTGDSVERQPGTTRTPWTDLGSEQRTGQVGQRVSPLMSPPQGRNAKSNSPNGRVCTRRATKTWTFGLIKVRNLPYGLHATVLSQPPQVSTMEAKPQQQKRRERAISALNVAIEGLNLAKELSSITPAKVAFGSVNVILTMIKVSLLLFFCWSIADGSAPRIQ